MVTKYLMPQIVLVYLFLTAKLENRYILNFNMVSLGIFQEYVKAINMRLKDKNYEVVIKSVEIIFK